MNLPKIVDFCGGKVFFLKSSKDEERAKVEEAAHETLQQKIDRFFFCKYWIYQILRSILFLTYLHCYLFLSNQNASISTSSTTCVFFWLDSLLRAYIWWLICYLFFQKTQEHFSKRYISCILFHYFCRLDCTLESISARFSRLLAEYSSFQVNYKF